MFNATTRDAVLIPGFQRTSELHRCETNERLKRQQLLEKLTNTLILESGLRWRKFLLMIFIPAVIVSANEKNPLGESHLG